jgi:hypothetical protein
MVCACFFVADLEKEQEPVNKEPLKQDAMGWFSWDALPEPMIPGSTFGLKAYFNKQCYSEFSMDKVYDPIP